MPATSRRSRSSAATATSPRWRSGCVSPARPVHGIAAARPRCPLQNACDKFIQLEVLGAAAEATPRRRSSRESAASAETPTINPQSALTKAVNATTADDDGWTSVSRVGHHLSRAQAKALDPRTFGHSKLSSLVAAQPYLETVRGQHLAHPPQGQACGQEGGPKPATARPPPPARARRRLPRRSACRSHASASSSSWGDSPNRKRLGHDPHLGAGLRAGTHGANWPAAAVSTEQIRLGTLLTPGAGASPVGLAAQSGTVDRRASDGRPPSVSDSAPSTPIGAPFTRRGSRHARPAADEGLAVWSGLLADNPFVCRGTGRRSRHRASLPPPVQRPHPPVWCVGALRPRRQRQPSLDHCRPLAGVLPAVVAGREGHSGPHP